MYKLFYFMMVIGYFGCAISVPTFKLKVIGILLTIVNALLFYKG